MTNENENTIVETVVATAPFNVSNLVSEQAYGNMLKGLKLNASKTRELIQEAAKQAYLYAMVLDNYERASLLVKAVEDSLNARSASQLRLWFHTFAPFAWRKTDDKNYNEGMKFRKDKSPKAKAFLYEQAFATPWHTVNGFTQEEKQEVIESIISVESVKTRISKLVELLEKAVNEEHKGKKVYKLENANEKEAIEGYITNLKGMVANAA